MQTGTQKQKQKQKKIEDKNKGGFSKLNCCGLLSLA